MNTNHLHYLTVEEFIEKRSETVAFSTSPDGLPLLAYIPPPPRAVQLLATAANALEIETANSYPLSDSTYDGTPFEPLVKELEQLLKANTIHQLKVENGESVEVLPFPKPINNYIGETLLARLIGFGKTIFPFSNLKVDTRANPTNWPPPPMDRTFEPPVNDVFIGINNAPVPQPKFIIGQIHLALPLAEPQLLIARREVRAKNFPQFSFLRKFQAESIEYFREARLTANMDSFIFNETFPADDLQQYFTSKKEMPYVNWKLRIPRVKVAQVIFEIAKEIAELHEQGEIHGDLKPSNVLITKDGVRVIDSLGLQAGERSPAMTRGWAAPEQILGKSVSTQTDQYPIGLMLLEILKGVPYGEETTVSIPVGKMQIEKHTILRNPGIFIDPENETVEKEAAGEWRDFIEQCIRFESNTRFESMSYLADAFKQLIEQNSLRGELEMWLSFGECVLGSDSNGNISPCWFKS